MSAHVTTIDIAAPPEVVYAYATDPVRFAEWQRDVAGVKLLDDGRFETTRRFAGARNTLTQQVVRDDPPHEWAARGLDGPIRAHASIRIEPLDGGRRSRVTFTLDFEAAGLGAAILPLVRRQAAKSAPISYDTLRQRIEEGRQPAGS
jgi:uncharacterized protein YndB with AHSA1/START domain